MLTGFLNPLSERARDLSSDERQQRFVGGSIQLVASATIMRSLGVSLKGLSITGVVLPKIPSISAAQMQLLLRNVPLMARDLVSRSLRCVLGKERNGMKSSSLKSWWNSGAENDAAWRALTFKNKVFYEIGQKTLRDGVWQKYSNLDPVARGRALVQDQGWFGAIKPQGSGWALGAGETLSTGPTPLLRWALPRAAGAGAAGGTGYYLYKSQEE